MKTRRHLVKIDNPHIQSVASLILLTREYKHQQLQDWFDFRDKFLSKRKLVCTYCKRDDLIKDQPNHIRKQLPNLATIDHIYPLSEGGAKFDEKNCTVACPKCNRKKGAKILKNFKKYLTSK
jgi:5-methylcytosine-specific restriction endonuclease McrA